MTRRRRLVVLAVAAALAVAADASSGWWEVVQAEAVFDLGAARDAALEAVARDPHGSDAVAAAGWWLRQLDNIADPEEILAAVPEQRDPELGFLLARIEAELNGRSPAGTVDTAELAGPYGVFDTLDLERGTAPPDHELPPPGTVFHEPGRPFRVALTSLDGFLSPPETMLSRGVFVGLWTVTTAAVSEGWMAVEALGGYDLSVDGNAVAGARDCGRRDAEVRWHRISLDPGRHRVRADMASPGRPRIRISLFTSDGQPVTASVEDGTGDGPWAASQVAVEDPPATRALDTRLERTTDVRGILLAAALHEIRRDPLRWRRSLERAAAADPTDPWPKLGLAWFWMAAPTGDDREAGQRRAREQLRGASEIPEALLLEWSLALRERREEDSERLLGALVDRYGDDVRVIRMWIREALRRGWAREAEDGLQRLQAALPGSRTSSEVELEVLEALERWQERQSLLRALAASEPPDLDLVDELSAGCLVADAVALVARLRQRADDPDLDVELARLLYSGGNLEAAERSLVELRSRWGSLQVIDEMALAVAAGDPGALTSALTAALDRSPSSVELLSLAWRRGATPFYEPYRVSLDEVKARVKLPADEVDAVLLLDQAVERVFPDGSSLYYYHGVTRAVTPVGAQQAARLQQLPNSYRLKIRIHKPDGTVVAPPELREGDAFIELESVDPGDLVEEEYVARVAATGASRRGHLPPYVYRFADSERAFGLSEYLLLVPPGIELLVEGNFEGLERTDWEVDGLRATRWRAESVPPVRAERFAPPTSELLPWVSYAFGVTWQDVGDAMRDRLLPVLVGSPELAEWSAPLLAGDDPEAALSALVNAVVDEIETGRSGLDFGSTAASHFSRRRGNRLGIVAAVLLDAGWQVDLVMGRSRPFAGTHLLVPTFDAFILPLLRVSLDGRELWLDLEEERRGIGRIDPILQGSDGLLIPLSRPLEPVAIVAELPSFHNPDLEERMTVAAVVNGAGDARVTFTLPVRGPQAERLLEQIRSVPMERVPLIYQQMATNLIPAASQVTGRIERVDGGAELELQMAVADACRSEGASMVCRTLVFARPLAPILAALPTRRYPLIMPVPVLQRTELVIEPPEGWTMAHRPRKIETRWGSVSETIESEGRATRSLLRLDLQAQRVEPEDYPEFARFCHAVDELSSRPPVMIR